MAINDILMRVSAAMRDGDEQAARRMTLQALAADPDHPELLNLAGVLAGRAGDTSEAVIHFGRLYRSRPEEPGARANFATALIADGQLNTAEAVIAGHEGEPRLHRLLAQIAQIKGDLPRAADLYATVVALAPTDWEAWNNLGNVRGAIGDNDGAITALEEAIRRRPAAREPYLNLSRLLGRIELRQPRIRTMHAAIERFPDDPVILTELGMAEMANQDEVAAETAFEAALAHDPRHLPAYIEFAMLLENRNRLDDLASLISRAEAAGGDAAELAYIKAWHRLRAGDTEEALALAETVPETINPTRRAQLIGTLADRLGQTDKAFQAFTAMNRHSLAAHPPAPDFTYRSRLMDDLARLDDQLGVRWVDHAPRDGRVDPVFIVGFPRSGTTLLDTMLHNASELHVMEELPILAHVLTHHDKAKDLATLPAREIEMLRTSYFAEADRISPSNPGTRLIDKMPLHLAHAPLLHRLFPHAQFVFVERHPCDAVLSCFMQNFRLNFAMHSFTDLEEAARTYDAVMRYWTRASTLLPLRVVTIRYERMIADTASELRKVTDFLGLSWRPDLTDNRQGAAARAHIRTPSYSQVVEPLYSRSIYRWMRYRPHLEAVLPILAPWAKAMDYPMVEA